MTLEVDELQHGPARGTDVLSALRNARGWYAEVPARWVQKSMSQLPDGTFGMCVGNAIQRATNTGAMANELSDKSWAAFAAALPHTKTMGDGRYAACGHIVTWNDMPGRQFDEVLAAFDTAIGKEVAALCL